MVNPHGKPFDEASRREHIFWGFETYDRVQAPLVKAEQKKYTTMLPVHELEETAWCVQHGRVLNPHAYSCRCRCAVSATVALHLLVLCSCRISLQPADGRPFESRCSQAASALQRPGRP